MRTSNRVVIAFGSNLGNREKTIAKAIDLINQECGKVSQVSPFFKSFPIGFDSNNEFLNGCLLLHTDLPPEQLLKALQNIEQKLGRTRKSSTYEDRCIDLDIIFYESLILNKPNLQIPHPRYHERPFVIQPLKSLNLDFVILE